MALLSHFYDSCQAFDLCMRIVYRTTRTEFISVGVTTGNQTRLFRASVSERIEKKFQGQKQSAAYSPGNTPSLNLIQNLKNLYPMSRTQLSQKMNGTSLGGSTVNFNLKFNLPLTFFSNIERYFKSLLYIVFMD